MLRASQPAGVAGLRVARDGVGVGLLSKSVYLRTGPAVRGQQFLQRRFGAEVVPGQDFSAGPRDVEELQCSVQESLYGRLIGGIEDRLAGAPAAGGLVTQL